MSNTNLFPLSSEEDLRSAFIGKSLLHNDIPLPSAILDISKIKHNCQLMLDACSNLNLSFRAHVKTHKTSELTRLQVGGETCKDVRLIVSTVIEAESLVPLLKDYQSKGARVNVLYGIPLGPSKVTRLAAVAKQLGYGTVSAMLDNVAQLDGVRAFKQQSGGLPLSVFIKADSGYHRAGLLPNSDPMVKLIQEVSRAEQQGDLCFLGFYSHNSLSYNGNSPDDAMAMLKTEIDTCRQAATHLGLSSRQRETPLVISVGASPTALSVQNILSSSSPPSTSQPSSTSSTTTTTTTTATAATALLETLNLNPQEFTLEIHAGVYPVLDMQQISANSRSFPSVLAAHQNQAMTILAEVVSIYPDRTGRPEALVSAGTLALGREPCKSYPGWAVVTSWNISSNGGNVTAYTEEDSVDSTQRMIVSRISQEHGIVGWEDESKQDSLPLKVGDKVRLWVNHACIAGVGFGWYLIVDSERGGNEIVDVWAKWRGW